MEEDSFETLDELHESILSLCQDDDEALNGEEIPQTKNEKDIASDNLAETPQKVCSTPGPCREIKDPKEKEDSSSFHLSPSKMSGIQLPVLENKRLSCLQTPLALAGLSPIVSISATPRQRIKSNTPNLKRRVRHFSSTPCVGPYQPKRLSLNETYQQTMMTISEIDGSFMEQAKTVENLSLANKSKVSINQVSKIKMDSVCIGRKETPLLTEADNKYFKDASNTTMEKARFSQLNYSKIDETIVAEAEDDVAELTADILGLENYIVLDTASQDDEDTIMEEPYELGNTSIFGAETIPVKSSVLLGEETVAVNYTPEENLKDSCSVKKERASSPGKGKNIATVTPMVHDVRIPSPTLEKQKEPILSEDDSVVEVIMVDESVEVIDISDDSVVADVTVMEAASAKTTDSVTKSYQDVKQTSVATSKANQASAFVTTGPSSSTCSTAVSTSAMHTSIVTTPKTTTLPSLSRPQPSVSPNEPPYTLNEEELMKLVKCNWGTDPVHDVNNNLTVCSYRNKQTPNVRCSILEGNFRIPPLLRSNINKNDLQIKGQGKTPAEIANSISKQLTNIDKDYNTKMLSIEANKEIQVNELKHIHKGQIQVLRQRQIHEMRSVTIQLQMDPMNYWHQCNKLQLYTDHEEQKVNLQYNHNVQMRGLLDEIEEEKCIVYEQAMKSKNNLTQIKEKLEAAKNQNSVDPDMVHTTVDLYKGPCKSNDQKQSLVQVCLPADIASYMIREEEIYNMNYKYKNKR
ncbi:hypothetical protein LOTGIDRAFT_170587 [Lottia gigantea]|uniref:Uncharacterized protein n=1 Tax=Lottia gigantea TaxID=225164 RepID=V4BAR7_LOTGI|nr:hypothetical protein LOTGIDRAFT_170587 [Lottia gigantea]ESP04616.1 hypothetical protein LOTGIDRAFT_170587 [Lottia gigantea]